MNDLGGRSTRQRALGPVMRWRALRTTRRALIAVVGASLVVALTSTAATANSASPTSSPLVTGSVVQNADGTVTVTASGTWLWSFGVESATTAGLDATVIHPCDQRTGVGWGVVWSDPNDPGTTETYTTKRGTLLSRTVNVGSRGVNPANNDDHVMSDPSNRCGTFVQTNVPHPGDGYDTGAWRSTHVYASAAVLPTAICVITYDLGFSKPPTSHRLSFDNNDNSVQWQLFKNGSWDNTTMGFNCSTLPAPVAAPPVPTTAAPPPPVTKTVSHTPPTPPAAKVTAAKVTPKPSTGVLAFTGFGQTGQLLALLGFILVLLGVVMYFVDLRRAAIWFLGL
jgi:cell division septation protein DedD